MEETINNTGGSGFTTTGLTPDGVEVAPPQSKGFTTKGLSAKTEDDWLTDDSFIADARTLADYMPIVNKRQGASEFLKTTQGKPIVGDNHLSLEELEAGMAQGMEEYVHQDGEFTQGAMEAIGQIQWNFTDLGLTAMGVSEWPEEAQMALIRSMKRYDDMPTDMRHVGRSVGGIASDPTTYLGFGVFAKAIGKLGLKVGATELLKKLSTKVVTKATAVASAEGAAYMAGDNAFRQAIDNKGDFSKIDGTEVAKQAAIGGAFGGGLGFFLSKAFGPKLAKGKAEEPAEGVEVTPLEDQHLLDAPEELDTQVKSLEDNGSIPRTERTDDGSIEGELLDDGSGTGVATKAQDSQTTEVLDPTLQPEGNARNVDENAMGEDWSHMYEGDPTFNVDRLETIDDVKGFIESSSAHWEKKRLHEADMNPDGIETLAHARAKADEEAQLLKEETGGDISEILEQYKGDHQELQKIRHRAQALRKLNVALGERVFELAEKHKQGGLRHEEAAELIEKAGLFANTMELTKLASREFSRGLGNYRLIMKGDPTLMEGLQTGKAMGDVGALADTILSMSNAGKGKLVNGKMVKGQVDLKGLKKAMDPKNLQNTLDGVIRFRSAMMLSGPSTIEAAGLSNMAKLWTEPFVEWVAHLGRGSAKKKARVRAMAQYAGNRRFFFDSWKQAAKAWKNGQHITDPFVTKIEGQQDQSLANMSWVRRNVWERGVHGAHLALLFLDEGIKANRSRSLIYADTVVEAAEAGLPPKGEKFEALLQQNLMAKIDGNGAVRDKEILREIRETTFTSDLEGGVGKLVNDLANLGGGWGRLIVVPFIRAPINIVSESLMYVPFSKVISAKQQNIMEKGSPMAKAKLKARKQLGVAAISTLYYAAEEDIITGSGPADYKQRELWKAQGYEPNSIRIGDQWVSYAKLGPMGLLMGLVADVNYLMKMDTSGTNIEDAATKYLSGAVYAVTNNVLNKAYFSSVSQLMDGLQNPDRLKSTTDSWFLSFTPNILNQMNQDENVREANTFLEKLQRRIPILTEKLGKQYDLYGREIIKPAHDIPFYGYMFKNREVVKDDVAEQIFKLSEGLDRAIVQKPMYSLGVTNTDFRDVYDYDESESVYAKFNRMIGEVKDPYTGDDLHKALERMMQSDDYKYAPHSTMGDITPPKVKMIQSIVNSYRGMAKEKLHNSSHAFRQELRSRENRIDAIFQ